MNHILIDGILLFIFICLFPSAVFYSLYYPDVLLEQGLAHRIFYFHVPVAWVALYGPLFSSIAAMLFLFNKNLKWDTISFSLNQLALLFAIGVLFSGPVWANSAWGVPWDWTDARLQSFFILMISLLAYFVLRNLLTDVEKKPLYSSFLTILCAVNAVITWGAIRWVDNPGNHPSSLWSEKGGMDPGMAKAFWAGVIAYHVLFLVLFATVYRLERAKQLLRQVKETYYS